MKQRYINTLLAVSLTLAGTLATAQASQDLAEGSQDRSLNSTGQPLPEYPRRAQHEGLEGYAIVEFTVLPDGSVSRPAVRDSSNRVFSRAALASVEDWAYEPATDSNEPITHTVRFNFVGN